MKFVAKHPTPSVEGVSVEIEQDNETVDIRVGGIIVAHFGDGRLHIQSLSDSEIDRLSALGVDNDGNNQIEVDF